MGVHGGHSVEAGSTHQGEGSRVIGWIIFVGREASLREAIFNSERGGSAFPPSFTALYSCHPGAWDLQALPAFLETLRVQEGRKGGNARMPLACQAALR